MMSWQPLGVQYSVGPQQSQPKRHGVVPGVQVKGSQEPSTHDWQRPHDGTHELGSHM